MPPPAFSRPPGSTQTWDPPTRRHARLAPPARTVIRLEWQYHPTAPRGPSTQLWVPALPRLARFVQLAASVGLRQLGRRLACRGVLTTSVARAAWIRACSVPPAPAGRSKLRRCAAVSAHRGTGARQAPPIQAHHRAHQVDTARSRGCHRLTARRCVARDTGAVQP